MTAEELARTWSDTYQATAAVAYGRTKPARTWDQLDKREKQVNLVVATAVLAKMREQSVLEVAAIVVTAR